MSQALTFLIEKEKKEKRSKLPKLPIALESNSKYSKKDKFLTHKSRKKKSLKVSNVIVKDKKAIRPKETKAGKDILGRMVKFKFNGLAS